MRPIAILFEYPELSNAKSLIYSLFCLNSSIPEPKSSLTNKVVADSDGTSSFFFLSIDALALIVRFSRLKS